MGPEWGYSTTQLAPEKTVRTSAREINVSPKHSRELCKAIKGLRIDEARELLEKVLRKEEVIPYKRFRKERGHKRGAKGPGGFPVKPARIFLKLIDELEANAEFKGLSPDNIRITQALAHKGRKIPRIIERAFGKSSPFNRVLVHIELVGEETQ